MKFGTKIILQPSGNKDAREHYVNTIDNFVSLERISSFLKSSDIDVLQSKYEDSAPDTIKDNLRIIKVMYH
tara:strand:- start:838 stop:1050 length:213 start_codon:yes stop_codon:yes gene_type:complete